MYTSSWYVPDPAYHCKDAGFLKNYVRVDAQLARNVKAYKTN